MRKRQRKGSGRGVDRRPCQEASAGAAPMVQMRTPYAAEGLPEHARDDFELFVGFFTDQKRDLNATGRDGRSVLEIVKTHRHGVEYARILERRARATPVYLCPSMTTGQRTRIGAQIRTMRAAHRRSAVPPTNNTPRSSGSTPRVLRLHVPRQQLSHLRIQFRTVQ